MTILAPLRGVTIRCFRETFAPEIVAAGFDEAITPFIAANAGFDPLRDRELRPREGGRASPFRVTPQFIGKDPAALRMSLERIRDAGYATADLNGGCPYPMVRNKGRGSGLLRTPDVLMRMLDVGCETMGAGNFSLKTRLGIDRPDELAAVIPRLADYPLRFLTIHARTARQMYDGVCDWKAAAGLVGSAPFPIVLNGDLGCTGPLPLAADGRMVGRSFVRSLGARDDADELARRYLEASCSELGNDRAVLGRMKELLAYWKGLPRWSRRWNLIKICRTADELRSLL